jgi:hypothetical protein
MRCLRIYATPDGESHFDEIDIPTTKRPVFPDTAPFELSAHYPASRKTAIMPIDAVFVVLVEGIHGRLPAKVLATGS